MQKLLRAVEPCLANEVEQYASETGIPLEDCVNEALALWLDCIACVNLEALRKPVKPKLHLVKKSVTSVKMTN